MKARAFWSAFPSAMLVVILLGAFCVFAGYLLTQWGEGLLEAFGALPRGWGLEHDRALVLTAVVVALPVIVWAAAKYFRLAIAAEAELLEHNRP